MKNGREKWKAVCFLPSDGGSKVFASRNTRREPPERKTGRFIFTHGRPALRVIFSLSAEKNATFARERHDFSFPTSTVKLTSKSLRTTSVRKVHHFPPLAGLSVHARVLYVGTGCLRNCVPLRTTHTSGFPIYLLLYSQS